MSIKKALVAECLSKQTENAKAIEIAIKELQKSANDYGQPKDRYDSYRVQLLRKRDMLAKQLENSMNQISVLNKIDPTIDHKEASFGAVVITNEQKIFVSISLGKFVYDNEEYFAISTLVPFYIPMKGKRKGETFKFREKEIEILDIF
jgi:hypothetical protein